MKQHIARTLTRVAETPWHHWLFGAWFIVFEMAHNIEESAAVIMVRPLLLTLFVISAFYLILLGVFRHQRKVAVFVTLLVLLFFGFGHIHNFVLSFDHTPIIAVVSRVRYVMAVLIVLLLILTWRIIRTKHSLKPTTKFLNVVGLLLVLFNLYTIITTPQGRAAQTANTAPAHNLTVPGQTPPDIYYIVPDHYMSNDVLAREIGFDNSQFTDHLQSEEFKVFENTRSNYQFTTQSLASTLNMRYLDEDIAKLKGVTNSNVPLRRLIRHNEVVKNIKSLGYSYINVGSWWGTTRDSEYADVNYDQAISYTFLNRDFVPSEFEHLIVTNSALKPFMQTGVAVSDFTVFKFDAVNEDSNDTVRSALYQLEAMKQAVHKPGPKFTFMHLLVPHPDYLFNADCSYPTNYSENTPKKVRYLNQIQCANIMLKGTVDYILAHSDHAPVIIIQADEGMYPIEDHEHPDLVWWELPDELLQIKFSVIRALKMPGVDLGQYENVDASVNTFRILFNEYFGGQFEMLEDRSFIYKNEQERYNFREITDKIR